MADDQGKRPEDQTDAESTPNVQTGNEEDAVLLDELTALQDTEDKELGGVMQGRENAGGDALGVEDMGYLASVHQGGFSTEQEVLAGILPTEEDAFANDQDVVVDDEASDYIDGEVPETPFVSPEAERLDFDILDDGAIPEQQQVEEAPVQEEDAPEDPAPEQEQNTSDVFADTITPQALSADDPIIETPEEDELLNEDNQGPAASDDTLSGSEDQPFTFSAADLLGNDTDVDGDALSIIGFDQPENGTIVDNLDGTYTFTPNENWNGETDFTYTISDGNGGTDTATVTIDVEAVNDGPLAKDDALSGTEDQPITFSAADLLGNDSDVDGDTLSIIGFDQPENGTLVGNGDGTYTFTPNENWNGETDFTYTISDGNGGTDTATVTIGVDGVNDGPLAKDDALSGTEDQPITFSAADLLGNDSDVDGDTLSIIGFDQPENGTLVGNGDGTYTFTPNENWNGETDFTYTISDGNGGTDTATVTIGVDGVNDGPLAKDDALSGTEDQPITFSAADLLGNDSDVDGDTLSIIGFDQPENGTLVGNGDGTYTFTPNENWNGETDFTYTISDGNGGTDTATVTIGVDGVNDGPLAKDDALSGTEDQPITFSAADLLGNDSDVDGDTLSIIGFDQPENGTLVGNGDGTYTFTPNENWNGETDFTYTISDGNGGTDTATVTIGVDGVNDGPVAKDDALSGTEDQPITFSAADLLGNDTDVDGDTLSIIGFDQPENGTLVGNGDGTYTFTPNENWNGETDFTYTISDGNGGTDTATVTIGVDGVNDGPLAKDDALSGTEDQPITFSAADLLGNDSDVDGDTLSIIGFDQPENGTLVGNGDGTYTFTPNENWNGETDFTYTISDGNGGTDTATVTIGVDGVNDGPLAKDDALSGTEDQPITFSAADLLGNDSDVDGDTLSIIGFDQPENGTLVGNGDGTYTFTPNENWNGETDFTYTISDGNGGTDTATVTIGVDGVNDGPLAKDDALSGTEDQPITFSAADLLGNDSDVDGDTLSIIGFDQPENGTLVGNGDGTYTFTPNENWNGETDFTYTISDGNGGTDTATVTIGVDGVNDGPLAKDDALSGTEDQPITFSAADLLGNDSDVDGDTLSIIGFDQPENGTLVGNGDGTYTFTPNENWNGETDFTYTISDGNGGTDTATVTIGVDGVNDGPLAKDDALSGTEDQPITFSAADLLGNDSDVDGDTLSIIGFDQPENGTLVGNGDGTYTFTPNENWNGETDFTYTISDGNGGTDTATVTIGVDGVNDGPLAKDDALSGTEDQPITFSAADLLGNDSDVDGDTLSIIGFDQPENGTLVGNGDGTYTFTPNENWNGETDFTYTISDGNGGTDTATVTIGVDGVNDGPVVDSVDLADGTEYATYTITESDLLANASDVDTGADLEVTGITGGSNLTITEVTQPGDSERSWQIVSDEEGVEDITFSVTDNQGATVTQTASIDFADVDNTLQNDSGTTDQDQAITFNIADLLANDDLADGGTLTGVTSTANGEVTVDLENGTITFTPDEGYDGDDASFTYSVTDEDGEITTATVNIDITDIDNTLQDDSQTLGEDKSATIDVLDNDSIVDGGEITSLSQPEHGTVVLNDDGTVTYTPDENYNGTDSFTYTVTDNDGETQTATVNLTVDPENDAPVVDSVDLADGTEYATYTITESDLLANASDVDTGADLEVTGITGGSNLTITEVTQPGDSERSWQIVSDEEGVEDITFSVTDNQGATVTQTASIDFADVDNTLQNDSGTTDQDQAITFNIADLLANDDLADGGTLTGVTSTANGEVTVDLENGTITFTPDEGYDGDDASFTYSVTDEDGEITTATVNIDITDIDNTLQDDSQTLGEDKSATIDVLDNDSIVDGGEITSLSQPEHGTVVLNDDGTVTYTPDENYNGTDSFTYTVTDNDGETQTATVNLTVDPENDAPVVDSVDLADGTEYATYTITESDLLANASDVDTGADLEVTGITGGSNLTITEVTQPGDSERSWQIVSDEEGVEDITFSVTDNQGATVTQTASIDFADVDNTLQNDSGTTDQDQAITFNIADLLANDDLADGGTLTGVTSTANGEVTVDLENGTITFTPDEGYDGDDASFTYSVTDEDGEITTATVNIDITDIDNTLQDDSQTLGEDKSATIDVLDNDSIVDGGEITSLSQPEHGTVVLNDDGTVTYTPDENYNGTDSFTYTVTDNDGETQTATVNLTVDPENDAPVVDSVDLADGTEYATYTITESDLLANASDVDTGADLEVTGITGGSNLTITEVTQPGDSERSWQIVSDEEGVEDITFSVTDNQGATVTQTASIDFADVDNTLQNDSGTTDQDQAITFNIADLLANDDLADGGTLTGVTSTANGEVTVDLENGTITFTPDEGYDGDDASFTYSVTDEDGEITTATVNIDITDIDNTLQDDSQTLGEDKSATIDVLDNDSIVDGGEITSLSQPEHGTVVLNDDGTVTYTPDENYNGTDSFTYTVTDNDGETQTATVNLTVDPENDAPVVDSVDLADGTEYATYTITESDLLANASDVDTGADLEVTGITGGSNLTITEVTQPGDSERSWQIVSDEEGVEDITFSVTDNQGATVTQTASIDFADVDNTLQNDSGTTDQDQAITFNIADLLANDDLADGGTLTGVTSTANGEVTVDLENGTITFTPDEGYDGDDASFTYSVTDEDGEITTATVNIDITDIDNTLQDDSQTLGEDKSATIDVLDNDSIVDGGEITSLSQPEHGTVVLNDDGTVTYTPDENYNGTDSFTYTVTDNDGETQTATVNLTVDPENDAPVVDSVDLADGTEYATYTITESDLLANASDVDTGADLEVTGITGGSNLTITEVTQPGDSERSWQIVSDEEGVEDITFSVTDNQGATVTQTASIDFADVDNTLQNDSGTTDQDQAITFNIADLLANDDLADGGTLTGVTSTANGEVTVDLENGTITFTPDEGYDGDDASFTYSVTDEDGEITTATVNIDITDIDNTLQDDSQTLGEDKSATIDVLDNDSIVDGGEITSLSQPEHGTVVLNDDGTVTYTPDENYNGTDSFTYTVTDNDGETQTATVNLTVDPENDAPVVDSVDLADGTEYATYTITESDLLANASDVDTGADLEVTGITGGSNLTITEVTQPGDSERSWQIVSDEEGVEDITFSVTDNQGATVTQTASIDFADVDNTLQNDSGTTDQDQAITFNIADLLANDDLADGGTLTGVTSTANGEVTVDLENGTITFTPDEGYDGDDASFTYSVTDEDGEITTATVNIDITDIDNTLQDDSQTLGEDKSATIDVLDNDSIVDGGEITSLSQPEHGTVVLNDDGTVTYTPDENYNGTDSFTYTVTDNDGETQTATVNLTVDPENDAPVVDSVDLADGTEYATYTITESDLLANASDVDTGADLEVTGITGGSNLTITEVTQPGDSERSWQIVSDEEGVEDITFSVTDNQGATVTQTASIDFADVDNTLQNDSGTTDQDQAITFNIADLLANDDLADGGTLTGVTSTANGEVTVDLENGTITFTPDEGYDGDDASFTYSVTDEDGEITTATVNIDITDIDNTLQDDSQTLGEDKSATIDVLDNDSIVDGGEITSLSQPEHGTVVLNDDGTVTYTPDENYNGTDSFTYTVTDNDGETQTATVNLTVDPENDAPVVDSVDLADGTEYATYTITESDLLANASDVDTGADLEVTGITGGSNLTITEVTQPGDSERSWQIVSDEEGVEDITFSVTDNQGATVTQTASIDFADVDNTLQNDSGTTDQDQAITFNIADLLANDDLADGGTLTGVTSTANGEVTVDLENGTITFTPDEGYDGDDASFTYSVTDEDGEITTATVNIDITDIDNTLQDDSQTLGEDKSATIDVLDNDSIVDGGEITSLSQPEHGTVVLNDDGTVTYTPDENYNGTDSFTYTVTDNDGETQTATVNLTVDPENDAPVVDSVDLADGTEYATYTITESDLLANASDVDTGADLEVTGITGGSNLTITEVTQSGDSERSWQIVSDEEGVEDITFSVTDNQGATVTQTASIDFADVDNTLQNDSGTTDQDQAITFNIADLLANDDLADGGTLTGVTSTANGEVTVDLENGTITFTPDEGYDGDDASFTYSVTDEDGEITTATVNIDITDIDNTLQDDSQTLGEDKSATIDVLDNDSIVDGGEITSLSQPEHGTVVLNDDGTVTYTPDENYNGTDSFTYTVTDNDGETQTATVNLTVDPENDTPVAVNDSFSGDEDKAITFTVNDLLGNDNDVDNDSLSIAQINGVNLDNIPEEGMDLGNGTLTFDAESGTFTFTPDQDWSGSENLTYIVTDGEGGVAQANIGLNVDGVADTPDLAVSIVESDEAGTFDVNVSAAITDIDNSESLSISIEDFPEGAEFNLGSIVDGVLVISGDDIDLLDELTMTVDGEASDFNLTVTATATEPNGDQASTSLTASPDFDPLAQDDELSAQEDQPITFSAADLLSNDSDLDGDSLQIVGFDQPEHGEIVDNGDGTYTFTPDANWNGETDFTYTISDGNGGTDTATVTIDVTGVNDGPVAQNDEASTQEDKSVKIDLLDNDSDLDGDNLTITQIDGQDVAVGDTVDVGNGTVTLNADGTVTFAPDGDYSGTESFEYTVSDGTTTETATATVDIEAVADAPEIGIEIGAGTDVSAAQIPHGISHVIYELADGTTVKIDNYPGDNKNPADPSRWVDEIEAEYGQEVEGYTIKAGQNHYDELGNQVADIPNQADAETTVQQLGGNGGAITSGGYTEHPVDITVGLTDQDGSESLTSVTLSGIPDGATLIVDGAEVEVTDGSATIASDNLDSVSIRVPDGQGSFNLSASVTSVESSNDDEATSTASANVGGSDVNDAPDAQNDAADTLEDKSVNMDLLGNDSDLDGDTLTITQIDGQDVAVGDTVDVGNGTVTLNADGTVTFAPDGDYSGTESFEYTVSDGTTTQTATATVDVEAVADAPDIEMSLGEGQAVVLDGETGETGAINQGNYNSTDNGFTVTGRTVDQNGNLSEASADNVSPHRDGFGVNGSSEGPSEHIGERDGVSEELIVTFDDDVSSASIEVSRLFPNEGGSGANEQGHYDIYRDGVKVGSGTFDAESSTGRLELNIESGDGGGFDQIVFSASDTLSDGSSSSEHSDYLITSIEYETVGDAGETVIDFPLDLSVAETDVDGSETLSDVTLTGLPDGAVILVDGEEVSVTDGSVTLDSTNLDNVVIRVPEGSEDFNLTASVTSTEPNGDSKTSQTSIAVDVPELNEAPDAANDLAATDEDTSVVIDLLDNDTDLNGDDLTITQIDGQDIAVGDTVDVGNGTVTLNADGTVTFAPDGDYSGTETFEYTVTDGTETSTATASVDVEAVADVPDIEMSLGQSTIVETQGDPVDVTIGSDNYMNGDSGFTVTGRSIVDGELTEASVDNIGVKTDYPQGFGVSGASSGDQVEIGHDNSSGLSEQLIVDFDNDVSSVDVSFSWKHGGEDATFELYKDGVKVGEGTVIGGSDGIDPAITLSADNGSDFDQIVFSAPGNGDDYLINSIEFENATEGETFIDFPLDLSVAETDVDGSESLSDVTLTGLPDGAVILVDGQEVSVTDGSVTLDSTNLDNVVIRVPEGSEDFNLTASVTSTEPNGDSKTSQTSIAVDVPEVNDTPDAANDLAATDEDTSVVIDLLDNDTDLDGDALSITQIDGQDIAVGDTVDVGNGTVTLNADGTVTFAPDGDYSGTETFEYTVTDGTETTTATATVDIEAVADAPDIEMSLGQATQVSVDGGPGETTTLFNTSFSGYDGGFYGGQVDGWNTSSDAIEVWENGYGQSGDGSYIELNDDLNDHFDDATSINRTIDTEDGATYSFNFDYSGRPGFDENVNAIEIRVNGQTVAEFSHDNEYGNNNWQDGSFEFTGNGEPMNVEFVFVGDAQDQGRGMYIDNIEATQTMPDVDDVYFDFPLDLSVAETDVDGSESLSDVTLSGLPDGAVIFVDGQEVTVTNGSATLDSTNLDNVVIRVPEGSEDFNLSASVTSTEPNGDSKTSQTSIAVDVPEVNDAPEATNDLAATSEDTSVVMDLLHNDTDLNGDTLTITQIDGQDIAVGDTVDVGNGTVTLNQDGTVTFAPDGDYSGTESFEYTVSDGRETTTATASVDIEAVADAPTLDLSLGTPVSVDVEGEAQTGSINVHNYDSTDGVSVTGYDWNWVQGGDSSGGAYGGSSGGGYGDSSGGHWAEVESASNVAETGGGIGVDGHGSDDDINDGEKLIFSFDDDMSSVEVTFDSFSYNEHASYELYQDGQLVGSGTFDGNDRWDDTFTFTATDGQSFDQFVVVGEGCSDFHIENLTYTTAVGEDTPYVEYPINLSAAETDVDGSETLSGVTLSGLPAGAVLLVDGEEVDITDGSATISLDNIDDVKIRVPEGSEDFSLSAAVTSTDGSDTATTTQSVTVGMPENGAPVATDDDLSATEDQAETFDLIANDTDADGDSLTITQIGGHDVAIGDTVDVGNGTVTLNADGSINFMPDANFSGEVSFEYTVSDGNGGTDTGMASIDVEGVADGAQVDVSIGSGSIVGGSSPAVEYPVEFAVTMGDASESLADDSLSVDLSSVPAGSVLVIGDATVTVGENGVVTVTGGDDVSVDGTTLHIPSETLGEGLSVTATLTVPSDASGNHGVFDLTASAQTVDGTDVSDATTDTEQVGTGSAIGGTSDAVVENVPHEYTEFDEAVDDLGSHQTVQGTGGNDRLTAHDQDWATSGREVYEGGAGDDVVGESNDNWGDDVMAGGSGNDTLYGGAQNDIIYGDSGNNLDSIPDNNPDNGNDTLIGDSGDDTLYGEGGDDVLIGGANNDFLVGGSGDDVLDGGANDDLLHGGSGNDTMYGGSNDDTLYGGSGDDTMYGGTNDDTLFGNSGDDVIYGEGNNDTIDGGAGDDTLDGGAGSDIIDGGAGNDVILGGSGWGNDTMSGGAGDDLFIFDKANHDSVNGQDWVDGGAGYDTIQLNGSEGWTLTITNDDGSQDVVTSESAQIDEYTDSSGLTGQIDFDDGSTVIFEGVEKVEW